MCQICAFAGGGFIVGVKGGGRPGISFQKLCGSDKRPSARVLASVATRRFVIFSKKFPDALLGWSATPNIAIENFPVNCEATTSQGESEKTFQFHSGDLSREAADWSRQELKSFFALDAMPPL